MTRLTSLAPSTIITFTHRSMLLLVLIGLNLCLSLISPILNYLWRQKVHYITLVVKLVLVVLLKLGTLTFSFLWSYRSYYKRLGIYIVSCIIFCLLQIPIGIVRIYHRYSTKEVEIMSSPPKKKITIPVQRALKSAINERSYGIITGCSFTEARRLLGKKFSSEYLWLVRQSSYVVPTTKETCFDTG